MVWPNGRGCLERAFVQFSFSLIMWWAIVPPLPPEQLFQFRGSLYGFVAIRLAEYAARAHPISPRWDTVAMPTDEFRRMARPVDELLGARG